VKYYQLFSVFSFLAHRAQDFKNVNGTHAHTVPRPCQALTVSVSNSSRSPSLSDVSK